MPSIKSIPEEYSNGFQGLFLLDESDFNSVVSALKDAPLTSNIDKLSVAASSFKPDLSEEIEDIFLSVGSLTSFIEKGISIEEISTDISNVLSREISEAIEELEKDGHKINDSLRDLSKRDGRKILTNRLVILLNTERLYFAAKANDLLWEYSNVFMQGRIITDFRPIFNTRMDEEAPVGVIVHTLNLHYRSDDQSHKDIYFALDSADLKALKEILIRAEQKEKKMISVFNNSGVKVINN